MSENSKIEWTDHTFNPWEGCTKVSPGCAHCYAETRNARWNGGNAPNWGKGAPRRRTSAANWNLPLKWNRDYEKAFEWAEESRTIAVGGCGPITYPAYPSRPRVFCASLADWLDDEVPIEWLADLLDLIRRTPNLDWLLLTKRPENWKSRIKAAKEHVEDYPDLIMLGSEANLRWWHIENWLSNETPPNVWIGTTVEDQHRADERIPELLKIPAKVRFLSCEPLLGPVDLRTVVDWWNSDEKIHWVICGGESGPGARPMHPDWARSLRDQCQAAHVPFLFKQWGEWCPATREHGVDGHVMPENGVMPCGKAAAWIGHDGKTQHPSFKGLQDPIMAIARMGKKAAGRMLAGRTWDEFPTGKGDA